MTRRLVKIGKNSKEVVLLQNKSGQNNQTISEYSNTIPIYPKFKKANSAYQSRDLSNDEPPVGSILIGPVEWEKLIDFLRLADNELVPSSTMKQVRERINKIVELISEFYNENKPET